MAWSVKSNRALTDLLIALAISIIVNVSYFIFLFGPSHPPGRGMSPTPSELSYINLLVQVAFSFIQALILIKIASVKPKHPVAFWKSLSICALASLVLYFFTPYFNREGDLSILLLGKRVVNPMAILKTSFTFIVSILYVKILDLTYQRQAIVIENQQLKTENLQSRYSTLVSQINPHFFFNSLNSLSMLVRSGNKEDALKYIDRMSDTFRYIIQNGERGMVTLGEELEFLDSYKYLFEIRYANKLFFNISVDAKFNSWSVPSLSLQPIIENAVKHNAITSSKPLYIEISTENGCLVISNAKHPKIEPEPGTGVGLNNLSSRYMLLTGSDIDVADSGASFVVRLPLISNGG